jgi:glucokinase
MNELEADLKVYLMKRLGHVSTERVCSGLGIPNIYGFLKDRKYAPEPDWLAEELREAADPTPVIITHALGDGKNCKLCTETLHLFVSILGGEAGNLALKVLATGGVYLGGGIPPRIIPAIERGGFFEAFCSKGRLKMVLEKMPVYIIMNPKTALLGSACYGLEMIKEDRV